VEGEFNLIRFAGHRVTFNGHFESVQFVPFTDEDGWTSVEGLHVPAPQKPSVE
jgi:hypothetical protein